MYKRAFKTFTANWTVFLAVSIFISVFELLLSDTQSAATLIIYGLAALLSHRIILLKERYKLVQSSLPSQRLPYWGFMWRYVVFFLMFITIAGIPSFVFVFFFVNAVTIFEGGLSFRTTVAVWLIISAIGMALWGMCLALWGTCLPASAIRTDASFSAARQRSRGQVMRIFTRLALGPFAYTLASTACIGVVLYWVEILEIPVIATVIISSLIGIFGLFSTHLTATVLSMAYEDGEATS